MIYLELFLGFLEVGCFAFGGAYAAIPLIRDVVLDYGWINEEMLTYMIAVSESTPGPIMINLATYVGSSQGGVLGAIIATTAVALPAFLIILLITALLRAAMKNQYVQATLGGLKPCVVGIILATGLYMVWGNCVAPTFEISWIPVILTVVLAGIMVGYKLLFKKKLNPILLIAISAVAGIIAYGI